MTATENKPHLGVFGVISTVKKKELMDNACPPLRGTIKKGQPNCGCP
jgi:hypothetical protein